LDFVVLLRVFFLVVVAFLMTGTLTAFSVAGVVSVMMGAAVATVASVAAIGVSLTTGVTVSGGDIATVTVGSVTGAAIVFASSVFMICFMRGWLLCLALNFFFDANILLFFPMWNSLCSFH
tara:strand:- start:1226 stop:1588 length:363 start_codon:yes stop_codon:yes gene_type:complete